VASVIRGSVRGYGEWSGAHYGYARATRFSERLWWREDVREREKVCTELLTLRRNSSNKKMPKRAGGTTKQRWPELELAEAALGFASEKKAASGGSRRGAAALFIGQALGVLCLHTKGDAGTRAAVGLSSTPGRARGGKLT